MLDSITLSSLLASRLCHDLINPVGACGSGLEIMEAEDSPEMRVEAMQLINNSNRKALNMLEFSRMAFGASGAYGEELDLEEVKKLVAGVYDHVRAELKWEIPPGRMAKPTVRILMNLALLISDCVPRRESQVTISQSSDRIRLTGNGPKAKLKESLINALAGVEEGLEPKLTPAYLAWLIASRSGHRIEPSAVNDEQIIIDIILPGEPSVGQPD